LSGPLGPDSARVGPDKLCAKETMKEIQKKKLTTTDVAKNMNNWRDRDSEKITGIFKNQEFPGQSISFNFKLYQGDDIETYHLLDGERYTLPRGVVRHLNTACYYKEYRHIAGETGQYGIRGAADGRRAIGSDTGMTEMKKVHRFAFMPLDFSDDDGDVTASPLVEVTTDTSQIITRK
jgi:hypothetical protein